METLAAEKSGIYVKGEFFRSIRGGIMIVVFLLVVFTVFNIIIDGAFFTPTNISVVLAHTVTPAFIAWSICFLFTTGYTDLSLGAILILACNVGGELAFVIGYPGLILGPIGIGIGAVLLNVNVVHFFKIPSWITCIGMAMVYEAIMCMYSDSKLEKGMTVINLGVQYRGLGSMPLMFFLCIIGMIIAYLLFTYSQAGINIRALGSNRTVAAMMGISTRKVMLSAALIGGSMIGFASAMTESYVGMQTVTSGLSSIFIIFKPMAIFFFGQAFEKTVPLPVGIFIGSIFIAGLFNFLTWIGVPSGTGQNVIMGIAIIICGILARRGYKGVVK